MPNVFTYETDKVDYALAGIWVECNTLGETELTSKIEEMNTQDSQYGFISNTKSAVMTGEEQDAIQIFVENLFANNVGVGAFDDPFITNKNHSVIHIINTNTLEPIKTLGNLNNEDERIEVQIIYPTSGIEKVINGDGVELTPTGDKYIQQSTDIIYPYVAIDGEGNLKEVKFDNVAFINNARELSRLRDNVNSGKNNYLGWTVVQTRDIDMSSVCGESVDTDGDGIGDTEISWTPIGVKTENQKTTYIPFAGTYNGRYHTISNLYMNTDKYQCTGLFSITMENTIIQNLILENVNISNTSNIVDTQNERSVFCGGITGRNYGVIKNCAIKSGEIKGIRSENNYSWGGIFVGGITGQTLPESVINSCYNKAKIYSQIVNKNNSFSSSAGIVAMTEQDSHITNCYNTGEIISKDATHARTGGIITDLYSNDFENCYNIGNVFPASEHYGGIIAKNDIGIAINSHYCINSYNGYGIEVDADTLKTYYTDDKLGEAYIEDSYGINEGYPILEWQLNVPIYAKAYLNDDGDKIEVKILYNINNIKEVRDENGNILDEITKNKFYSVDATSGKHAYKVIDEKGNTRQLMLNIEIIRDVNDLGNFRDKVNNGTNFEGVTVIQVADIDMSSVCGEGRGSWEPIGTGDVYFAGTYDGGYHTISNMYINQEDKDLVGVFTQTTENTVIKNLILDNLYVKGTNAVSQWNPRVGGITGDNYGTIERCGIEAGNIIAIKNKSNYSQNGNYIGGVTGNNNGTILECYNKGEVYSNTINQYMYESNHGGISGALGDNSKFINCYNAGKVTNNDGYYLYTGGIIGGKYNQTGVEISNCYNIGEMSARTVDSNFGGIIGRVYSNAPTINNCYCLLKNNSYGTEVDAATLKTYATEEYLGSAYITDTYNINNGYPILEWELKAKKILGTAYVDTDEGKIVVEIIRYQNNIVSVVNENGTPLSRVSDTIYTEPMSDGTHTYTITDSEENRIKLKIGPIKLIDSANTLNEFRDSVNNGNTYAGVTVIQTADIDMSSVCGENVDTDGDGIGDKEISWTPIGVGDVYFSGTYDGRYHTIDNLYINTDEYAILGMFIQTTETTTIENLIMDNIYVKNYIENYRSDYPQSCTGGIVGMNYGKVSRCGIDGGSIIDNSTNIGGSYLGGVLGGIVGRLEAKAVIKECYNKGNVMASSQKRYYAALGGISGDLETDSTISNCYNTCNIFIENGNISYKYVGGIDGSCTEGSGQNMLVENCYNIGKIATVAGNNNYVANIVGRINPNITTVTNSYYASDVTENIYEYYTHTGGTSQAGKSDSTTLQGYASALGDAYTKDDGRNGGYPILKWELNR